MGVRYLVHVYTARSEITSDCILHQATYKTMKHPKAALLERNGHSGLRVFGFRLQPLARDRAILHPAATSLES
jgi:hypothetical protein